MGRNLRRTSPTTFTGSSIHSSGDILTENVLLGGINTSNTAADRLMFRPIPVFHSCSISHIVLVHAGSTGVNIRAGLYNTGSDGLPGTLQSESGSTALSASAAVEEIALAASVVVTPGTWWAAFVTDGAVVGPMRYVTAFIQNPNGGDLGFRFGDTSAVNTQQCYEAHTFGALPASAAMDTIEAPIPMKLGLKVA